MSRPEPSRCLLQRCNQRVFSQDSAYCSLLHASDAIELGQAEACVYCQKFAKNPGFSTCSKTCGALLSIERRMGGRVRGQGQAPPPPQPPPAPLVPPAPTSPSPTKNASKNEKNRARNESVYSCGCVIRILKMSPGGSVPNTCPVCPPPTRMESGAQTDSIDDPKTAASIVAKTDQYPVVGSQSSPASLRPLPVLPGLTQQNSTDLETAVDEAGEPQNVSVYFG